MHTSRVGLPRLGESQFGFCGGISRVVCLVCTHGWVSELEEAMVVEHEETGGLKTAE